jgi:predicted RNase H-like nuclease
MAYAEFLGIDACRAGWIASSRGQEGLFASFREALAAHPAALIAVDVPIGLSRGDRPCDKAARALLGPRRASVFPPPTRAQLRARARPPGVTTQAWALAPRLREADAAMTPRLQRRVVEAHPELAFAAFAGRPMRHPKRTAAGARERLRALGLAAAPRVPPGARLDDVLDARALAVQARRIAAGVATKLGGERDARGLRMEIWA